MSFFKASKDKKDLEQLTGGKYINASGCFPVNIIAAFVNVSDKGSTSVDLFVDHKDQEQVLYGNMRIANNDGSTNEIGYKTFNQLVVIAGLEEVSEPIEAELPIGKKGAPEDVSVLEDLSDIDVKIRVQMEYSVWNNNIQEKKVIRGFYRAEDNASAEEIVNGTEAGVQYSKDEKYFDGVTYKNDLDEESVQAWIDAKRPKGTGKSGGAAASPSKKPAFGKKKPFGKS